MAIVGSGVYVLNIIDVLDPTQLALDLTLATHKIALISNAHTPSFDTDVGWTSTNEVLGTGWATGGIPLSAAGAGGTSVAPTLTISPSGTMRWGMNDIAVAGTALGAARACRFYADALAGDPLILLVNFGNDYSTNNGTFGIQWAAAGVTAWDMVP